MWQRFEPTTNFLRCLTVIDDQLAEQVHQRGCIHCGGPLHCGDYPRKPRGLPEGFEEAFSSRRSWCCGHCRKRSTPPSVRFLGRKVYVGWLVFVAVIQWLAGMLPAAVPRRTLRRWSHWWRAVFVELPFWKMAVGQFVPPPPDTGQLPRSLVERFTGAVESQLQQALAFVAPVTTISASWVRVQVARAEDGI